MGFLTLPGHSGRASLRGISAPVVHISFCVRAVIATAFCQDANITTAITCVLSLGKNLTYHAARFLVCTRDKYYTAIQQINVSINRQYGIHPTAKDRGLSACYDRNNGTIRCLRNQAVRSNSVTISGRLRLTGKLDRCNYSK